MLTLPTLKKKDKTFLEKAIYCGMLILYLTTELPIV